MHARWSGLPRKRTESMPPRSLVCLAQTSPNVLRRCQFLPLTLTVISLQSYITTTSNTPRSCSFSSVRSFGAFLDTTCIIAHAPRRYCGETSPTDHSAPPPDSLLVISARRGILGNLKVQILATKNKDNSKDALPWIQRYHFTPHSQGVSQCLFSAGPPPGSTASHPSSEPGALAICVP